MLVDFNTISDHSRVWIYAAEKVLTIEQENYIVNNLSDHIKKWKSHNNSLTAAVTILESHFIVIALDENKNLASGCSIDILQKKIQNLEHELSVSLLNRLNVFCRIDDEVICVPSLKLSTIANANTLFYDLTIQKKTEINNFLKPIHEGWCYRLI